MWGLGTTGGSAGAGFAPPYPPPLDPVGMTFLPLRSLTDFFSQPNPPHLRRLPIGLSSIGYLLPSIGERCSSQVTGDIVTQKSGTSSTRIYLSLVRKSTGR
jgi:hypothetical protein